MGVASRLTLALLAAVALPGDAVEHLPKLHLRRHGHHNRNGLAMLGSGGGGGGMGMLGSLIGDSQRRLASAEAHHEKVVKQAREHLTSLLAMQSEALGSALGTYAEALTNATESLAEAVNTTKVAVEIQEKAANKPGDGWGGPEVEARARLSAKVQIMEREMRRLLRKQSRTMEEAKRQTVDTFEDATSALSRKIGDASPILDEAKASLERSEAVAAAAAVGLSGKKGGEEGKKDGAPGKGKAEADVDGLAKALVAAKNSTDIKMLAAQAQFDAQAEKAKMNLTKGVAAILGDLAAAEKEELKSVHGSDAGITTMLKSHILKSHVVKTQIVTVEPVQAKKQPAAAAQKPPASAAAAKPALATKPAAAIVAVAKPAAAAAAATL
eukprot:CAMPEP_0183550940 /NCGR_PEP_ID=MMETSP0371-20130417/66851_1 /TAXON_ID=268820 /ORGANISM="Peridinium aciculiferum, Strain PAER-2" /LENGTH=382 /DNA_ID=CAMNT_0025755295 /DNA_START=68 /DNA_END=1212 /DNA_ORIENTATION=+